MKSFKKAFGKVGKFFKKAGGDTQKFFKKGGQFQKGVGQVAGGLGSVSKVLRQGVNIGNKIVGAIEKSPVGSVLSPITTVARSALNVGKMASNVAGQGKQIINDARHGDFKGAVRGITDIKNSLERAKPSGADNVPQFV